MNKDKLRAQLDDEEKTLREALGRVPQQGSEKELEAIKLGLAALERLRRRLEEL